MQRTRVRNTLPLYGFATHWMHIRSSPCESQTALGSMPGTGHSRSPLGDLTARCRSRCVRSSSPWRRCPKRRWRCHGGQSRWRMPVTSSRSSERCRRTTSRRSPEPLGCELPRRRAAVLRRPSQLIRLLGRPSGDRPTPGIDPCAQCFVRQASRTLTRLSASRQIWKTPRGQSPCQLDRRCIAPMPAARSLSPRFRPAATERERRRPEPAGPTKNSRSRNTPWPGSRTAERGRHNLLGPRCARIDVSNILVWRRGRSSGYAPKPKPEVSSS